MTKKVLYTDFKGIDDIISTLSEDEKFKKAITKSNLFKFWKKIVDEKFKNNSKPYSMTANAVMVIACKNSTVAQELLFRKTKLLQDLQPYLKSLKMTVKDLRFDAKKWVEEN